MSCRFADSFRAGPGWILVLLERCLQTYMTYTEWATKKYPAFRFARVLVIFYIGYTSA